MNLIRPSFNRFLSTVLGISLIGILTADIAIWVKSEPAWIGLVGWVGWVLSFVVLVFYLTPRLTKILKTYWQQRQFLTLISLILLLILVGFSLTNKFSLSGETTQEVNCVLSLPWRLSPSYGWEQSCFLGYPIQQYLLPALPSQFLGRTQLALNLGGTVYFWLGAASLVVGVYSFVSGRKAKQAMSSTINTSAKKISNNQQSIKPDLDYSHLSLQHLQLADHLTAIGLVSLIHFRYFNHFLLTQFEQSQYPLSLGLILLGLLLSSSYSAWLDHENRLPRWLFAAGLIWASKLYTPALALIPLGILWWMMTSLTELMKAIIQPKTCSKARSKPGSKTRRLPWIKIGTEILLLSAVVITTMASLKFRSDLKLTGENSSTWFQIKSELSSLLTHLTYNPQGNRFFSWTMTIFFWLVIILAGWLTSSFSSIVVIGWILITTAVASLAQGYAYYGLDFRVHRALVMIPAWIYLVVKMGRQLFLKFRPNKNKFKRYHQALIGIWLWLLISGGWYYRQFLQQATPAKYLSFIRFAQTKLPTETAGKLYLGPRAQQQFISLNDNWQYFYPDLKLKQSGLSTCTLASGYWLLHSSHRCWPLASQNHDLIIKGYFPEENPQPAQQLGENVQQKFILFFVPTQNIE